MLNPIQTIAIDWKYLEPQNLLLIILVLTTAVTSSLLVYFLERRNIPKLAFDGVWKRNDKSIPNAINYFIRVKREKGEGRAQGVPGFVGIKDKLEPDISTWFLSRNTSAEITRYDYLALFKTFDHDGKKVITFPGIDYASTPSVPSFKNFYNHYKKNEITVNIEATRGRINKKHFVERIDSIVDKAQPMPS